jgi:hypothetical protein
MRIADPPNYGNMTRQFLRPARRLVTLGLRDASERDFVAAGWRTAEFLEIVIGSQCWLGAVRKYLDGLSRRTPSYLWCQPDRPGQLGWVANCGCPGSPELDGQVCEPVQERGHRHPGHRIRRLVER